MRTSASGRRTHTPACRAITSTTSWCTSTKARRAVIEDGRRARPRLAGRPCTSGSGQSASRTWEPSIAVSACETRQLDARRRGAVLIGADHLEALVDEDVMRPVDADIVDLVVAAAELHYPV